MTKDNFENQKTQSFHVSLQKIKEKKKKKKLSVALATIMFFTSRLVIDLLVFRVIAKNSS